jgi:hypothetical protein
MISQSPAQLAVAEEVQTEIVDWINETGVYVTTTNWSAAVGELNPTKLLELWRFTDQAILDSWYEFDQWMMNYIEGIVNTPVQTDLKGMVPVYLSRLGTPINLGSNFASFGAVLRMSILPTFEVDKTFYEKFMRDAVFNRNNLTEVVETDGIETAFGEVRKYIDVIPLMNIDMAICAFLPSANEWGQALMQGLEIDFFGGCHIQLAFPPMDTSGTDRGLVELREWSLRFELDASYTDPLPDDRV